jgi:hypothetical protein
MYELFDRTQPFARERLTVSNTVKKLTSSVYNVEGTVPTIKRRRARVCTENADIRVTSEGTNPVATTTGTLLPSGSTLWLHTQSAIARFKAIRDGSSDGSIEVEYYR